MKTHPYIGKTVLKKGMTSPSSSVTTVGTRLEDVFSCQQAQWASLVNLASSGGKTEAALLQLGWIPAVNTKKSELRTNWLIFHVTVKN